MQQMAQESVRCSAWNKLCPMAKTLRTWLDEEVRVVISALWTKYVSPLENRWSIGMCYYGVMTKQHFRESYKFRKKLRSHQSTATSRKNVIAARGKESILENRRVTIPYLSAALNLYIRRGNSTVLDNWDTAKLWTLGTKISYWRSKDRIFGINVPHI